MKELQKLPQYTVVKVTYQFPWRSEPEKEIIGLVNKKDDNIVMIDYPAQLVDKEARELNINESPQKLQTVAGSLAIYNNYEYTVKPVSTQEIDDWYQAAHNFYLRSAIADMNEGKFPKVWMDVPENVYVYVGHTFSHKEVK